VSMLFDRGEGTMGAPGTEAGVFTSEVVLTRLHHRYDAHASRELTLLPAPPLTGGREVRDERGALEAVTSPSFGNSFQARYTIRHAWQGAIACATPQRGRWNGRPLGAGDDPIPEIVELASRHVPAGEPIELDAMLRTGPVLPPPRPAPAGEPSTSTAPSERSGGTCAASPTRGAWTSGWIAAFLLLLHRRRRSSARA